MATNNQGAWNTKTAWKSALQAHQNALQMRLEKLELEEKKEQIKQELEQLEKKLQMVESEPPGGEFPVLVLDKNALVEVYGPSLSTRPQFLDVKGNGSEHVVCVDCVDCCSHQTIELFVLETETLKSLGVNLEDPSGK